MMTAVNHDLKSNKKLKEEFQGIKKKTITPPNTSKVNSIPFTRFIKLGPSVLRPSSEKARKHHNCLAPEILQKPRKRPTSSNLIKRNSVSLVELSSSSSILTHKQRTRDQEQGDNSKLNHVLVTVDRKCSISFTISREECELARKVCKTFLLNAWRCRRNQVIALQNKTQQLENEVGNFNLQIVVLRSLLESEKLRVAVAMSDSAHLRSQLGMELKCTEIIKKELDCLKAENFNLIKLKQNMNLEIESLRTKLISEEIKCKNYQETSDTMKKEVSLAKQKELECFNKLKGTECELKNKINSIEAMWVNITKLREELTCARFENARLREENETKESKANEQITIINEKCEELTLLQEMSKVQQENIVNLSKDLNYANEKIKEQNQLIESLSRIVQQFEKEKNLIKTC